MIGEYWQKVQTNLEGLTESLDEVQAAVDSGDTWTARNELKNVRNYVDAVYSNCESWYCDDTTDEDEDFIDGYSELVELLPAPDQISAGDMASLLDVVRGWKETHGYGY